MRDTRTRTSSRDESAAAQGQEFKLCYVEGSWAWFTTDLDNTWGDDWDDAPYEHNAGNPYEWRPHMAERGVEPYRLLRVAWHAHNLTTPDEGHLNSLWSVDQINAGDTAWLINPNYGQRPRQVSLVVYAGATPEEFAAAVEADGGAVYLPKEASVVAA